ncbi:RNA polymerase sigma-70 factor (sigma-E family) [Actinoplanes lutulentus]|uniref:RNA polymerase sigma-70 factor (Sigma-E family) n=1 Tax=Actinoplanes lutulentus TaxID=1287878 RepID=A0A327YYZ1_9ACTN|nr:SigE family RNA polymerase sigma factor [Actinoplanes lutulentus]MBB2949014.1 RNA polymerase sigma-70 factor (sigma-E family) [Actinoplanes lutulentus]RAK26208.1 RNA polymerase sigma-70 factor (sigma-E family) [Actinoplanes lutulentus]
MRFEEFAAARLPALLRYATLLSGDHEQAKDLVQDVLTKALLKWRRIGALEEPYAYVRTMLTNEYLSFLRRRRVPTVPLGWNTPDTPTAEPVPGRPDEELWRLLGGLPRQQRAVIVLRYYEGLSDPEIAEVLKCRPTTVRAYASRALAALRVELSPRTVLSLEVS